jgi:hypothetical protein
MAEAFLHNLGVNPRGKHVAGAAMPQLVQRHAPVLSGNPKRRALDFLVSYKDTYFFGREFSDQSECGAS